MKGTKEGTDECESDRRGRFAATTEQRKLYRKQYPSVVAKIYAR
jgi:hypothetical protein